MKSNDSRHLCNNFCNKVSTCRNFNCTAGFVYSFTIPNLTFMFPYILRNRIREKRIYMYWLCITQFVIFNHWKVSRNRTSLYWKFFMSPALMRRNWRSCKRDLFFQILLFLWNNSLAVSKLQTEQGDSSENYPICPLRNVLESCYSFQSKWDTRSANNNIFQGVCKIGIIGKRKIYYIWGNGQNFTKFEGSICQGISNDTKN